MLITERPGEEDVRRRLEELSLTPKFPQVLARPEAGRATATPGVVLQIHRAIVTHYDRRGTGPGDIEHLDVLSADLPLGSVPERTPERYVRPPSPRALQKASQRVPVGSVDHSCHLCIVLSSSVHVRRPAPVGRGPGRNDLAEGERVAAAAA